MFHARTVFVVGAGASNEVNLPVGAELAKRIGKNLRDAIDIGLPTSSRLAQAIQRHVQEGGEIFKGGSSLYRDACSQIATAMPLAMSIDNYIEQHSHNPAVPICGKLAIADAIVEAERMSRLRYGAAGEAPGPYMDNLDGVWYRSFFQMLSESLRLPDLDNLFRNVSFLTFNYDRCIEHFLYNAIQAQYHVPADRAAELVSEATIIHIYGSVGLLEWQQCEGYKLPFGGEEKAFNLNAAAREIVTFSERENSSESLTRIRDEVANAQVLVFLGFRFYEPNMLILTPDGNSSAKRIYATGKGMSDDDCFLVADEVRTKLVKREVSCHVQSDLSCYGLFERFWRSMRAP